MQSNKNSLSILVSPAFLVGLGLLLLNDFFLKAAFHNWFTGKLSDFAGLFIFPLFFTAFVPKRKRWIYAVTAIGFVFWKSGFSQPLIDLWNAQPYFNIGRVIDYTDLIALMVLPVSFLYGNQNKQHQTKPLLLYVSCIISVFAFAATSPARHKATYSQEYKFDITQARLLDRMVQLTELRFYGPDSKDEKLDFDFRTRHFLPLTFEIDFAAYRFNSVRILVSADGNNSKISLISAEIRSFSKPDKEELVRFFEEKFIGELKKEPVKKSTQINGLWFKE